MENYTNFLYFGDYKSRRKNIRYTIIDMLLNNVLNVNGSINNQRLRFVSKGALWVYLYYLWQNNMYIEPFNSYKTSSNGSILSASLIKLVKDIVISPEDRFYTKKDLSEVINKIVIDNDSLSITIISQCLEVLFKKLITAENDLQSEYDKLNLSYTQNHNFNIVNLINDISKSK